MSRFRSLALLLLLTAAAGASPLPASAQFSLFGGSKSPEPAAPAAPPPAAAPPATAPQTATPPLAAVPVTDGSMLISWEVRNRFRLFREERDFREQVEALSGLTVLTSEQTLGRQSEGRGWARNVVNRLCIDLAGRVNAL